MARLLLLFGLLKSATWKRWGWTKEGLRCIRGRCAHCNALDISDFWCVVDISGAHVSDILIWLKPLDMWPQVLNRRDTTQWPDAYAGQHFMLGIGSFLVYHVCKSPWLYAWSDGIGGGAVKDALSYQYVIATGIFRWTEKPHLDHASDWAKSHVGYAKIQSGQGWYVVSMPLSSGKNCKFSCGW